MTGAGEKILIVGPSWVGDMMMAQTLFILLKQQNPDHELTVLAPAWTLPLLARMPEVSNSMELEFGHGQLALGKRKAVGRSLRGQFDRAIVLPNSAKSALIPWHANIPLRTGWRGELRDWLFGLLNDCRRLDKQQYPLMVQRFAALAFPADSQPPTELFTKLPKPMLSVDREHRDAAILELQLNLEKPVLALCPGAEFGDAKQWPAEHYAALANSFLEKGWQVWLFGSGNDRLVAEAILADINTDRLKDVFNLAGATNLGQAIDLLSCATAVVSNDSGLMHIAAALQKPIVALYGSTSPDFTPPLAEHTELLTSDIECRPCFKRVCPYGHRRCLTELGPERAVNAVEILSEEANQGHQ